MVIGGLLLLGLSAAVFCISPPSYRRPVLTVYVAKDCAQCQRWVKYLGNHGFRTVSGDISQWGTAQELAGVPSSFRAPVFATVNGQFVQGFVPAHEIHRLVQHRLGNSVRGLTVSGVLPGAPGIPAAVPGPYVVYAVLPGGLLQPINFYNEPTLWGFGSETR